MICDYSALSRPPSPFSDAFFFPQEPTEFQRKLGTVLLLAAFTAIGVVLTDLGFVVSFAGAVLGSALVFIFPSLMWISKCKKEAQKGVVFKVGHSRGCPLYLYSILVQELDLSTSAAVISDSVELGTDWSFG